jgi:hypothetical protein
VGNGTPIKQYTCNGSVNQSWYEDASGNYFHIAGYTETLCMTTGGLTGNSTPIVQYDCNGSANQKWSS